jgi:hypothetical protein
MDYYGDEKLQYFLNKWDRILNLLDREKIGEATLAGMFERKIRQSKQLLVADVAHYRRMDDGEKDKTYEWLKKRCETALRLKKEDKNQDGNRKANREGQARPDRTAAPAEGGAGKGKGKDKSKKAKKGKGKGSGKKSGGASGASTPGGGRLPPESIPCKFIYMFKSCTKGADCPFAHRTPTAAEILKFGFSKPAAGEGGKGKSKTDKSKLPCFNYAKGACKHGNDCMFLHAKENKPPKAKAKPKGKAKAE